MSNPLGGDANSDAHDPLLTWQAGESKRAIVDFVERVTTRGDPDEVPAEDRIAVFDNDGTLWCEKPMPIQLDFILRRLVEMAEHDPQLRTRQPWRAAYTRDYVWLNDVITAHYRGDDTALKVLAAGVLTGFAEVTVEEFEAQADTFLRAARHPTLDRSYLTCSYTPMVELLKYLRDNGFRNYIVSGGGRDFMRPISEEVYGYPATASHWQRRVTGLAGRRHQRQYLAQASGRCSRRRSGKADSDLEQNRPTASHGSRQQQRRHSHAEVFRATESPRSASSSTP